MWTKKHIADIRPDRTKPNARFVFMCFIANGLYRWWKSKTLYPDRRQFICFSPQFDITTVHCWHRQINIEMPCYCILSIFSCTYVYTCNHIKRVFWKLRVTAVCERRSIYKKQMRILNFVKRQLNKHIILYGRNKILVNKDQCKGKWQVSFNS